MEKPDAEGRYLCAHVTLSMRELVGVLKTLKVPHQKLPKIGLDHPLGDLLVRLSSYLQPSGTRSFLQTHLGRVPRFDNQKVRQGLGLEFRPMEETLQDTIDDLKRWGHL